MKKVLVLSLVFLIGQFASAFDIVYPRTSNITINSPSTFFIGSARPSESLTVNGESVRVHSSGGFAHVVTLNEGENTFEIKSGDEIKNFVITKPVKTAAGGFVEAPLIEYSDIKPFLISVDNAPLRETPVDAGINRLSHLQKDIPLFIDGEQGGFYRVVLGIDNKVWIAKNNVKPGCTTAPAKVIGYDYIDTPGYFTFVFHLDRRVPFEIVEGENFYLRFYNVYNRGKDIYEFDFPYAEAAGTDKIIGYSGRYEGNDFVWKIRKFPQLNRKDPLKNITIAVDAGHGGTETGTIGCLGDKEKDINLKIAKYLEHELKHRGAKVVMTRSDDTYTGLGERVDIANENDAAFLISIHGNAVPDNLDPNEHKGTSVYYYYNQAKPLAANILVTMTEQLGTENDKVRQGSLALVRNTNALSVLIETGYLINPEDNSMLVNPHFQKKCAKAIADGIENYLVDKK